MHTLGMEVPRHDCRESKRYREQIQGSLLGEVVAEFDPASAVKDGAVETALATAQQSHAVLVRRVLARAEPVLMLRALALTVDPRLRVRLAA